MSCRSRARWRSRPPRWSPRRCSTRCAGGCSSWSTAASTGPATTPRPWWRRSTPGGVIPWTSTRCGSTCWAWCTKRSSPPRSPCGPATGRSGPASYRVLSDRLSDRQRVAGLQQGLEVGQDARPAFGDARQDGAARLEAVVDDGQLDQLAERLDVEGDLGAAFGGEPLSYLVADVVGGRPLRGEAVPGVGEPPVRIGFQHDLLGVGDRDPVLDDLQGHHRSGLPVCVPRDIPVAPGEGGGGQPLPEALRGGLDVSGVDEVRLVHFWVVHF